MTITIEPISFGRIAILDNAVAQTVEIAPDGSMVASSGIVVVTNGSPARLEITGAPPQQLLDLDLMANPLQNTAAPPAMTLSNWSGDSGGVTDINGELVMRLGATLTTDPGITYPDKLYFGTVILTVNY